MSEHWPRGHYGTIGACAALTILSGGTAVFIFKPDLATDDETQHNKIKHFSTIISVILLIAAIIVAVYSWSKSNVEQYSYLDSANS